MASPLTATMNIDKRIKPVKHDPYMIRFDTDTVLLNTVLPKNKEDIPRIIGLSAPARSGTTAFLYLLASQPNVDRAYFQPQMAILRTGGPIFNISPSDKVICLKEVFGGNPLMKVKTHDPIQLLLDSGVPADKITWVTMLREPMQEFGSLLQLESSLTPEIAAETQEWTLELFERHKKSGVKMIPYVYELAQNNEEGVVSALFAKLGLPFEPSSLNFDLDAINRKLVPAQLADPAYFEKSIVNSLDKSRYSFKNRGYGSDLPDEVVERVKELCDDNYLKFRELAKLELSI